MSESSVPSLNHQPKPSTLVMKFGGTSVGTAEAMTQAVHIVIDAKRTWDRVVVTTSALSGVTNLLLDSANAAARGETQPYIQAAQELRQKHYSVIQPLIPNPTRQYQVKQDIDHLINDFISLCQAIAILGEATPRALDAVGSLGERMAVRILAPALESKSVPAQFVESTLLVITDDHFQSAHPDFTETTHCTRQVLEPILAQNEVPVVTGFIGATPGGVTTTLGRGGSDYSAAILAAALPADEVWIWTDVDGVMTADPRLVPNARTINELSYREVSELAYFGAKVLHPKTIIPVIDAGIGLRVCNTFNPGHPGTRLVSDKQVTQNHGTIKAVTAVRGLQLITVEGRGMLGVPGVAARTFGAVAATGTSVPLITQASSEQTICFAVPMEATAEILRSLQDTFANEIARQDIDRVWATEEVVIITIVGEGMRSTPGISGRIFSALGEKCVNVIAIAQGSSEVGMSLVVAVEDILPAVQCLHDLTLKTTTTMTTG
ncbi:MAG: aspartate kinase [Chloroflexi bacterium]|nr:aspartate kinase [Chloroflexota bacterium]